VRWEKKHHTISYFLSNTSVKNYRNRIVYFKVIASHRWVVVLSHGVVLFSFLVPLVFLWYFAEKYIVGPDATTFTDVIKSIVQSVQELIRR